MMLDKLDDLLQITQIFLHEFVLINYEPAAVLNKLITNYIRNFLHILPNFRIMYIMLMDYVNLCVHHVNV